MPAFQAFNSDEATRMRAAYEAAWSAMCDAGSALCLPEHEEKTREALVFAVIKLVRDVPGDAHMLRDAVLRSLGFAVVDFVLGDEEGSDFKVAKPQGAQAEGLQPTQL